MELLISSGSPSPLMAWGKATGERGREREREREGERGREGEREGERYRISPIYFFHTYHTW